MRPLPLFALTVAASLLLPSLVSAQSSTPILGFYKFKAPKGNTAWTAGLITKTEFQSKATSVTTGTPNSTITQTGAGWTPGAFSRHYVEFLDDPAVAGVEPWTGLILDIAPGNTDTALTVKGTFSAFTGLGATPLYCIREHATLGTLFVNGAGLLQFEDLVTLFQSNGTLVQSTYDGAGGFVSTADFSTPTTNTIVYPGQGWVLTITNALGTEITIGGDKVAYVKSTPTKYPLYHGVVNLLGPVTPLVPFNPASPGPDTVPISQIGILQSSLAEFDDLVTVLKTDGSILTGGLYQIGDLGAGTVVVNGNFVQSNNDPFIRGQAFSGTVTLEKYFNLQVAHPIN